MNELGCNDNARQWADAVAQHVHGGKGVYRAESGVSRSFCLSAYGGTHKLSTPR